MTEANGRSIFSGVDFHSATNNLSHHTSEVSQTRLVVRRGQEFTITLNLTQPFDSERLILELTAKIGGEHASKAQGALTRFSYPDNVRRAFNPKGYWKVAPTSSFGPPTSKVKLSITSPADALVGEYELFVKLQNEEKSLGKFVMLFNPWCPEDSVFLSDEAKRQEYILNEHGIIYKGSVNYLFPSDWDYGQFEENMVDICLKILDRNLKYLEDPLKDIGNRSDPIYVGRVVSAMINAQDDNGVLEGRWSSPYTEGRRPTHWTGSYAILNQWLQNGCQPVKYGQCWVFAGVMCSVLRLLGIPCRVVSNFSSAHDVDMNLTIDRYFSSDGLMDEYNMDSVWNFHVWTEGWMTRPDLGNNNQWDGWQVLDPTPQEMSDGVYCCGPASVKGILNGHTEFKYDTPFVFAEVNADCVDWMITADGEAIRIDSDTKSVGKNISTKAVGSRKREDITDTYKHAEGSFKERLYYTFATTRDYSNPDEEIDEENNEEDEDSEPGNGGSDGEAGSGETGGEAGSGETGGGAGSGETGGGAGSGETGGGAGSGATDEETTSPPPAPVTIRFKEVSKLINGKDVNLNLVLQSKSGEARPLSIHISVQAMRYNGVAAGKILAEDKEETLQPGKALSVPILVPFLSYHKLMVESESMKISVVITDKKNAEHKYLATHDVVLLDPPIKVTAPAQARLNSLASGEAMFTNPVNETLTNCIFSISGVGLFKEEIDCKIPDLPPNHRVRVKFYFVPYKKGERILTADFDCSAFRDIKGIATINVA